MRGETFSVAFSGRGARRRLTIAFIGLEVAALVATAFVTPAGAAAPSPQIVASPTSTVAGTTISVLGSGFTKNQTGYVSLDSSTERPSFRANGKGTFSVGLAVPLTASIGTHTLAAHSTSQLTRKSSSTSDVTVASSSITVLSATPSPTPDPPATPGPTPTPTPVPTAAWSPPPVTDTPGFQFVITVYNDRGANIALGEMKPYLRAGDIFLVVSGNNNNPLNVAWVNDVAARLVAGVPGTTVYAATAGTANGATLAAGVSWPVTGVAYDYEPNMANEPEFSWDFATTQANFQTFASAAHVRGLLAIGTPTGRPLLEGDLLHYGWSYGTLGTIMDAQTPQFQGSCRQGLYPQALDKAIVQYQTAGAPQRWYPEVSLALDSINGVSAQTAIACTQAAVQRGLPGTLVWWAPPYANEAITYLAAFRSR